MTKNNRLPNLKEKKELTKYILKEYGGLISFATMDTFKRINGRKTKYGKITNLAKGIMATLMTVVFKEGYINKKK